MFYCLHDYYYVVFALFSVFVAILAIWLWFIPLNRVRRLATPSMKRNAYNKLRKSVRKNGKLPPPFPNGWYILAESRDIKKGSIIRISALGEHFLIFRGSKSGQIFVVDAYCPHLGADLSYGGEVKDDKIVCPFHLWSFNGETGVCEEVPYSKQKNCSFAKLRTYESREVNSSVYVWYHGDKEQDPLWAPVDLEGFSSMVYQGRSEYEISCHIQDIPENGADVAHLDAIHKAGVIAGGAPSLGFWAKLSMLITYHKWQANWKAGDPDNPHTAEINLSHKMIFLDRFESMDFNVKAHQIGPSVVHLHFSNPFYGEGVMIQSVLPLEPMLQRIVHTFYTEPSWSPPIAKFVLWIESILIERDIGIWNRKTYVKCPVLVKEDALILKHRRWYSQFYSEDSVKQSIDW